MILYYTDEMLKPEKAHEGDAGIDLKTAEDFTLLPGSIYLISTGVRAIIPGGFYAQILGRSGLAVYGVAVLGGVIDRIYRGEIKVQLANLGKNPLRFKKGDRIAQLVCIKIDESMDLRFGIPDVDTERGEKGFGSSGLRNGKYALEVEQ